LPQWSREEHHLFPAEFRAVVWQLVHGHYSTASILNTLPMDVLELVITHVARDPYSCTATLAPAAAAGPTARKRDSDEEAQESATKRHAAASVAKLE
jgi:hypothetical protein